MTDLINDICIDVKRMQSLAKGFLSLGKHYSKENLASNRPTSYPSHGDLIGQTEVVDDHVLIHNSKLTQKIQAMSNEINHLKYKLALKEVSSNEDVKLKADRQAFLSQVDPVVTDKEKVSSVTLKFYIQPCNLLNILFGTPNFKRHYLGEVIIANNLVFF